MDLKELNEKLADLPYVSGYTPSQADVEECKKIEGQNLDKFVHVKRWAKHIASFSDKEKKAFPGAPAPAPAAKASKGGDDDDDIDLFGSDDDDEEAEKAKAERAAKLAEQKKGAAKAGPIAKSNVILDIKVWDDETDLKQLEEEIRKISLDGLLWGKAQLVPVAFGMNKLQMVCVVEDEKVSVQDLTDQIEEMELVQSTDIAAFQKI